MDQNNTINQNSNVQSTNQTTIPMNNSNPNKKIGPIIAILVIVLVLVIIGLYMFATKINKADTVNTPASAQQTTEVTTTPTQTSGVQSVTNTSDEVDSLQKDLNDSTKGLEDQNL